MLLEGTTMDGCMTHAAPNSNAQHAHSISPCVDGKDCGTGQCISGSTTAKPDACNKPNMDCLDTGYTFMRGGWSSSHNTYGGIYGIGRDGHVIYGPFNAAGETWACEDLDMCNGFFLSSGDYAYASTIFFPYVVGCWGPAYATHTTMPTCTTNGCGTADAVGLAFSGVVTALLAVNALF